MFTRQRLLTPGPTMLPDRVRLAMAQDMIHHRTKPFKELFGNIQIGLKELFGTEQTVIPLSSSGTGAMVAAVTNLFAAGEKVLVINAGKFAQRWENICETYNVEVVTLDVEWGHGAEPEDVAKVLDSHPDISGVLIQLSETSTGVMHPVKEIAQVTAKRNILLIVDGVSGVSISPCPMDAWGIDCLITGSQKGLLLPPGLSFIALSDKAWKKREKVGSKDFYFNLVREQKNLEKEQTGFTPAVGIILGLHESLTMFKEVGLDQIFRKQWALTMMVRTGVTALGFELFAKKYFTWGITSIILPDGIKARDILDYATKKHGVTMTSGQDAWEDKMLRIGHMGWVDYGDLMAALYALADSFKACGGSLPSTNYIEQALAAYSKACDEGIPPEFT